MQTNSASILVVEEKMREGDDELLAQIISAHSRFLYRIAYVVLRNHHDAEDVVQESFLRLTKHLEVLPTIRNQRAWLSRIIWRMALNRLRPRGLESLDDREAFHQLHSREASPEELAESRQMLELTDRLVQSLPLELREPLLLSLVEGMTSTEVGQILELPDATVRNRIFRARKMLSEKLESMIGRVK